MPLLCRPCEDRFALRETVVSELYREWMEASPSLSVACARVRFRAAVRWPALRYYLLSVFWRLSVADTHEYRNFKMPESDEESLRLELLELEDAQLSDWEFAMTILHPWGEVNHLTSIGGMGGEGVDDTPFWLVGGLAFWLHRDRLPPRGRLTQARLASGAMHWLPVPWKLLLPLQKIGANIRAHQ